MPDNPFQTELFVRHSVPGESLRNHVSAYNECQLNDEITDLIVADIFNSIRDDWDSNIADSIRHCLSIASRISEYARNSKKPDDYLLSILRNEMSSLKLELGSLANNLGIEVKSDLS